jgi:hypothetical protein
MMKFKFLIHFVLMANLFAQGSISGKITRADSEEPLLGVNILVQGTFTGTVTNAEGQFKIEPLQPGEYTLFVSMIGFEKHTEKDIVIADKEVLIEIQLKQDVLSAPQVVVTASRNMQDVMELPVSMSVIGPRKIHDRAAVNLVEVMKFEPGIS